jgi:hypothetical protein
MDGEVFFKKKNKTKEGKGEKYMGIFGLPCMK